MRRCLILTLTLVAASTTAAANAQQVAPTFSRPTFWTCDTPPAFPPGTPASFARALQQTQQQCGGPKSTSGWFMTATFAQAGGGGVPAGKTAIQNYVYVGIAGETRAQCGDTLIPFGSGGTEYFNVPILDVHTAVFCCEQTYEQIFKGQVAFLPVPNGAPPIAPGERAGTVARPLPNVADPARAVRMNVEDKATLYWRYHYEYDFCNRPAATSCGQIHCLTVQQQPRNPNPPAGQSGLGPTQTSTSSSGR